MVILLFFSFLAGIVTVLSPCILPVLPALLSAGGGKGHLRPMGIICGLVSSFIFFTLFLTALVNLTGISPDFLRYIAVALITLFGLTMIFPVWGEKFAEWTAGVADFGQVVQAKSAFFGTGFWSGFILGIALGLVWTPCAGPILAAITTLVATSSLSWSAFFITLAYSLGAAIPILFIIYGGKKILNSSKALSKYSEDIRKVFGVLMIFAALAIAFHYDVKLQQVAIQYVPLINIEDNPTVRAELEKLRRSSNVNVNKEFVLPPEMFKMATNLPKYAKAPELVGIVDWINSQPLMIENLKGKVVLIDFWTYSCINCIRTFPYLKDWYAKYKDKGLVIVGVHTPEFEFEKNPENVKEAVKRFEIAYPVAVDSNYKTWQNYNNLYWPAHYLIDQKGVVRDFHFGEGAYMETENAIRNLLGMAPLEGEDKPTTTRRITPETYLGYLRANSYTSNLKVKENEAVTYSFKGNLGNDEIGLEGSWKVEDERIVSTGNQSKLSLNFLATRVYLVMDAPELSYVTVLLDGKPLPEKYRTTDMNEAGQIMVKEPRKYDVVNLKGDYGRHVVTLVAPKGVAMYAFSFGDEP